MPNADNDLLGRRPLRWRLAYALIDGRWHTGCR